MNNTTTITLNVPSGGKTWLAEILGEDEGWGLDRGFLDADERDRSRSGRSGMNHYHVTDGVYESQQGYKASKRRYWIVADGEAREITRDDVLAAL